MNFKNNKKKNISQNPKTISSYFSSPNESDDSNADDNTPDDSSELTLNTDFISSTKTKPTTTQSKNDIFKLTGNSISEFKVIYQRDKKKNQQQQQRTKIHNPSSKSVNIASSGVKHNLSTQMQKVWHDTIDLEDSPPKKKTNQTKSSSNSKKKRKEPDWPEPGFIDYSKPKRFKEERPKNNTKQIQVEEEEEEEQEESKSEEMTKSEKKKEEEDDDPQTEENVSEDDESNNTEISEPKAVLSKSMKLRTFLPVIKVKKS